MKRPRTPHHLLAYGISLPERLLRLLASGLGVIGLGLMRILPRPIREGKFYKLAVERQLKMLTDDVGQAGVFPGDEGLDGSKATRMAVGGAVDNLMMIGLHASPMWILLAATDVSKGAKRYMEELATELKEAGVMEEGSRLDNLDDVLGGLHRLSDKLADTVDMPPLSIDDMKQAITGVGEEMLSGANAALDVAGVDDLAEDISKLAHDANHSLLETTGAVAVGTMKGAGNILVGGLVGVGATVKFVGDVVWNDVLSDYGKTIKQIYRRGFYGSVRKFLKPQTRAYRNLFNYRFLSVTEMILSFGLWRKAPWRLVPGAKPVTDPVSDSAPSSPAPSPPA